MSQSITSVRVRIIPSSQGYVVPIPAYATDGSAGMDLSACIDESVTLLPGERRAIPTGIALEMPGPEMVGLVYPRSGLGTKHGIVLSNCVGVIDSDYRGEVICGIVNQGQEAFTIEPGQRIAQLVFTPVMRVLLEQVDSLNNTSRGAGGFGSTGR